MGKIVFAGAMSHVLDPDYYQRACGAVGRQTVDGGHGRDRPHGRAAVGTAARRPDRRGRRPPERVLVQLRAGDLRAHRPQRAANDAGPRRGVRQGARSHARPSIRCTRSSPTPILEQGMAAGFDLALSWEAPVDHAFLSPVNTLHGPRPIPPLVPIFVNAFVAPQPTARRCFAFGQHIAPGGGPEPVERRDHRHRRAVALPRALAAARGRDRHGLRPQAHPLDGDRRARPLQDLTADELHKSGSHEFLNWMVLLGAVTPARAARPLLRRASAHQPGRRGVEPAVSRYAVNSLLYRLKKDRGVSRPLRGERRRRARRTSTSPRPSGQHSWRATCGRSTSSAATCTS